MYRKMLVPLDGSQTAEAVFVYAKELAGRLDIGIVFLHVCTPQEDCRVPRSYVVGVAETIKRQAREVQDRAGGGRELEVKGEVVVGHPAEEILSYAEKNGVDLILMSAHGRSGMKRWAIGSVASKVLRASKVPLWLVKPAAEGSPYDKWPKRTILAPLDGSELAESVLPHVEALTRQRGPEPTGVVLLRVCEPASMPPYYIPSQRFETPEGVIRISPQEYLEKQTEQERAAAAAYLAAVASRLKDAGIEVRSEVLVGRPAEEIVDYAAKSPFSLIVMSTHARSGLGRWAFGSVASRVLEGTSSPVLVIRPG